ncbi:energy transducer TonB [uncultured Tenacibaculum sp.]|uniref:energy transducer TonB n=1 Tax=uncultured Tenacibaculum sp. TaxID=174713 RepID=UPI00261E465B|nr:energy transducer TonB [uncultured Tenacibaculum sp.]
MKKLLPLICLTVLTIFNSFAQAKVCETSNNQLTDINDIGISKCEIEKSTEQTATRAIKINKQKTKTRFRKVNAKKNNLNQLVGNSNIQLSLNNQSPNIQLPTHKKAILFDLVEEVPLFSGCKKTSRKESSKCFKTKLNKHIAKYFHPEEIIEDSINEKILIQFTIGIDGKISNIKINSKSNNKMITKELTKIIKKSPDFTPGKEQGFPVNVIYSFPINLTLI